MVPAMWHRLLILGIALALLPALPATATAKKKAPKPPSAPPGSTVHKFSVTFFEKRTTTWSKPAHKSMENCAQEFWDEGSGTDSVELKTRLAVPALYVTIKGTPTPALLWNAVELTAAPRSAKVSGVLTRSSRQRSWTMPGACGGPKTETPRPDDDCGTRLQALTVLLSIQADGLLRAQLAGDPTHDQADHEQSDFDRCFVLRPKNERQNWDPVPLAVPRTAFTDRRRKTITLSDTKRYQQKSGPGERPFRTTTKVEWKIQFTRVR